MAKIAVISEARAKPIPTSSGQRAEGLAYQNGDNGSILLESWEFGEGDYMQLGPSEAGAVVYVWRGEIRLGDKLLSSGSSALIEAGAVAKAVSGASGTRVVYVTSATRPDAGVDPDAKVYLLSADRVPQYVDEMGGAVVKGGLHANAEFEPCPVWLHENSLPGVPADMPASDAGIHSHAEDEVIFVTGGEMRLGNRVVAPGTAIFITADAMYGFNPGSEGLSFINFRAGPPDKIKFKNGMVIDEIAYWRDRVATPEYVALAGAV